LRQLNRILRAGWTLIDALMALMMFAMIAVVFANVVLRYGFASALLSSVEVSRFLFVWIVMLGAAACLRHGEHLRLDLFADALSPRPRRLLFALTWIIILAFSLMLFLGGLRQTTANWANIQPMSGLPVGALYLAGVVGGALMAAIAALRILSDLFSLSGGGDAPGERQ
jgi:TRAP-type transport system small permease protein